MVGAFGGRKGSEDFAGCDADGFGRARGLARPQLSPADIKKLGAAMREKAKADRSHGATHADRALTGRRLTALLELQPTTMKPSRILVAP